MFLYLATIVALTSLPEAKVARPVHVQYWSTSYLNKPLQFKSHKAHIVRLSATFNDKTGSGEITFDPNVHGLNAFGDPTYMSEVGYHPIKVTYTQLEQADPENLGRRVYELQSPKLEGRFYFVTGPDGSTAPRF